MNDWTSLYRSVFPDLVRFLHRKVWDEERAKDLAQEAFVRALREEPDKPRPFCSRWPPTWRATRPVR
jgi:DNA-directed RNA polymerase specialized sigma24 family protein